MFIRNYPEDSILRRHWEASAELKRRIWRQKPPEDSILKRHQVQLAQMGKPSDGPPMADLSDEQKRPDHTHPRAPTSQQSSAQKKGLFGWLGRLLGGQR
jgi:hypothetical protein